MDAFFASVEQRDNPTLRGLPVAVGGEGPRSVVCAASYEARQWGVRSAMPMAQAQRRCPQLTIVPPRFSAYKAVSKQVHAIFADYTDLIEPLSLDEAFLDVTNNKRGISLAADIARDIQQRIRNELHLTASAGVSYNKFLAKIASDYRKPNGFCTIHPSRALHFIDQLPIEAFWGVGRVTAQRMISAGIHTGKDLRQRSEDNLVALFGKAGHLYYNFARGIDHRPVETERERKSVGCECTFERDINDFASINEALLELSDDLERRLRRADFYGRTLTLKVKFHDFQILSRSQTHDIIPQTSAIIHQIAIQLLDTIPFATNPIRLLGLSLSHPIPSHTLRQGLQLSLFPTEEWNSLVPIAQMDDNYDRA